MATSNKTTTTSTAKVIGLLKHQVLLYVTGHLNKFSQSSLSLLPVATRKEILLILPAVNVHQLEGTLFTNGIDLNEVWKTIYELRIPNHMRSALLDLLKRPEIDHAGLDLTWKEKYLICSFDSVATAKSYRKGDSFIYLFEILLFCVPRGDFDCFNCLLNISQPSSFNLKALSKLHSNNFPILITCPDNDQMYSNLLTLMPASVQQGQGQMHSPERNFIRLVDAMEFLQHQFNFRPRILLLHHITLFDHMQNILWPTVHFSDATILTSTTTLRDFLQDVQVICMRSRGWNAAKNLAVLRTIFQILVSNRHRVLSGIVLDLSNIGVPAQNQILATISSTLTGLLLIPHQAHIRAARQSPYNCLTIFSACLSLESPDEMKHINAIVRSQLQLEVAIINCNNKAVLFGPRMFDISVYISLFESVTLLVFTNPALKYLELSQVIIPCSLFQNLIYHFLSSTSATEQVLSLSCIGIMHSPLKSKVPVCKSKGVTDAGKHGPRSLKLHLCHFAPEVCEWLGEFPKIVLKSLHFVSTDITDDLSAMVAFSNLKNLETQHIHVSAVSSQELWKPLKNLLSTIATPDCCTAMLYIRNILKEHLPNLISVLKASPRTFTVLNFMLTTSSVKEMEEFKQLLRTLFSFDYLNDLSLVISSSAFRKNHLLDILQVWEVASGNRQLKSFSVIGDSTTAFSNLPHALKNSLEKVATHYCDFTTCGCLFHSSV